MRKETADNWKLNLKARDQLRDAVRSASAINWNWSRKLRVRLGLDVNCGHFEFWFQLFVCSIGFLMISSSVIVLISMGMVTVQDYLLFVDSLARENILNRALMSIAIHSAGLVAIAGIVFAGQPSLVIRKSSWRYPVVDDSSQRFMKKRIAIIAVLIAVLSGYSYYVGSRLGLVRPSVLLAVAYAAMQTLLVLSLVGGSMRLLLHRNRHSPFVGLYNTAIGLGVLLVTFAVGSATYTIGIEPLKWVFCAMPWAWSGFAFHGLQTGDWGWAIGMMVAATSVIVGNVFLARLLSAKVVEKEMPDFSTPVQRQLNRSINRETLSLEAKRASASGLSGEAWVASKIQSLTSASDHVATPTDAAFLMASKMDRWERQRWRGTKAEKAAGMRHDQTGRYFLRALSCLVATFLLFWLVSVCLGRDAAARMNEGRIFASVGILGGAMVMQVIAGIFSPGLPRDGRYPVSPLRLLWLKTNWSLKRWCVVIPMIVGAAAATIWLCKLPIFDAIHLAVGSVWVLVIVLCVQLAESIPRVRVPNVFNGKHFGVGMLVECSAIAVVVSLMAVPAMVPPSLWVWCGELFPKSSHLMVGWIPFGLMLLTLAFAGMSIGFRWRRYCRCGDHVNVGLVGK